MWTNRQVKKGAAGFGCSELFLQDMIFTAEKVLLIVTFIFFLSETEIIVPNTGGETLNGKTY